MAMTSSRDRMSTIKIEIPVAVARINPNTFAAFSDDRHLFVSRELILLLEFSNVMQCCQHNLHHRGHREEQLINPKKANRVLSICLVFPLCPLWLISLTDSNLLASIPSSHLIQTSDSYS